MKLNTRLKRLVLFLTAMVFVSIVLASCSNKGCTDKNALNYNVVANKDDNSCEFCDSTLLQAGQNSGFLYDQNSASPYYLAAVAKFTATQTAVSYNYSSCGENNCSIVYTIENLVDQEFELSYSLSYNGNNLFFNTSGFITIPGNSMSDVQEIPEQLLSGDPCGNLTFGSLNASAMSTIVYH